MLLAVSAHADATVAGGILHEEEAAPLNAYLNYTQHGCRTGKAADFLAAAHVPCAFRQR